MKSFLTKLDKKKMKAMEVFNTEVRARLEEAKVLHKVLRPGSKSLRGTDYLVLKYEEPIVIEVDRFVEIFREPLADRRFSTSDLEEHCKKVNLEWASVIVNLLFKVLNKSTSYKRRYFYIWRQNF